MARRMKTPAMTAPVPADRDSAAAQLRTLGDVQRQHARLATELNDALAALTAEYQPELDRLGLESERLTQGLATWAEAHRSELTQEAAGRKSLNLITGLIGWRQRPPSVRITGQDAVLEALRSRGLSRFIRVKESVNKEAILNEPEAAAAVPGLSILSGIEDFFVEPFEQEVTP